VRFKLRESGLGGDLPCVQFGHFKKDGHPLLCCFSVDLELTKSLFFTGPWGKGNCVTTESLSAFGDVHVLLRLLSHSLAASK
jgi:hypothetical protein